MVEVVDGGLLVDRALDLVDDFPLDMISVVGSVGICSKSQAGRPEVARFDSIR